MKTGSELISVIIPVYQGERFLEQAVRSALNQTWRELEVLVIDDGSRDSSPRIARQLAASDPRVKFIPLAQNAGVANARNTGIRLAEGNYIAMLDSDDVWAPDKLARQMDLLRETGARIAYCSYDFLDESGRRVKKPFLVPPHTDFQSMLAENIMGCSATVVQADLLKRHPMRPEFLHEDYVLWMELLSEPGVRAVGIPDVLVHYRLVSGSRSHNKLKSAVGRWRVYRKALHLGLAGSMAAFLRYAVHGIIKYSR